MFGTLSKFGSDLFGQGKSLLSSGKTLADTGVADTDKSLKYFSDIMSGNPSSVLSAAAPEVNAITGQTNLAKKSLQNSGNRSGGTNAKTQDLTTGTIGQVANTLNNARGSAATNVANIGESKTRSGLQELGAGLGAEGTAVGAEEGAGSAGGNLASIAAGSRKTSQDIHDNAVQQWADAISTILFGV